MTVDGADGPPPRARAGGLSLKRLAPVLVIAAGFVLWFAFDLDRFASIDHLREHHERLTSWVARMGVVAGLLYALFYAVVVAFSVPGGAVMTITAGFLFGTVMATIYVVVGATLGATVLFLAARYAFADYLRAKAGPWLERFREGFNENGLSYMLSLRLIPLFPFWLVNLVPAFLDVPVRVYVLATLVGIIPGAFVYASLGDGLSAVIEHGGDIDLGIIFEPRFFIPIVGLAVLALLPAAYKWWKSRRA